MKILPVNYNLISNIYNKTIQEPQIRSPRLEPKADTFELSFTGVQSYLKPLMNSNNIHCPCCGVKMLSDKSYQELLGRASNIKSTKDFINLLTEYKEYIPKEFEIYS